MQSDDAAFKKGDYFSCKLGLIGRFSYCNMDRDFDLDE